MSDPTNRPDPRGHWVPDNPADGWDNPPTGTVSNTGTDPNRAPAPVPAEATYTVKAGDTLPSIARALYGHESNWTRLLAANSDNDAYVDADGILDPERGGFTTPLEQAGVVLHTDLERQPKRLRQPSFR